MKPERVLIVFSIVVLVLYVFFFIFLKITEPCMAWNEIGDAFGFLNALFAAMAFVLFVYTAMLQREDLKLQHDELKITQDEIKKANEFREESKQMAEEKAEQEAKQRRADILPQIQVELLSGDSDFRVKFTAKKNAFKLIATDIFPAFLKPSNTFDTRLINESSYSTVTFHFKEKLPTEPFELTFILQDREENPYRYTLKVKANPLEIISRSDLIFIK